MGNCSSAVLAGLAQDCAQSMGGVSKVLIAPYVEGSMEVSTAGTVTIASLSGTTWKAYYFRKGNASVTSTLNVDATNGVNYVSSELAMTFTKQETNKRLEMSALALGDVMVVYKDANGLWWALGIDNPVTCTAGSANTGAAKTDGNNYQVTLTAEDLTYPIELDAATVTKAEAIDYPV